MGIRFGNRIRKTFTMVANATVNNVVLGPGLLGCVGMLVRLHSGTGTALSGAVHIGCKPSWTGIVTDIGTGTANLFGSNHALAMSVDDAEDKSAVSILAGVWTTGAVQGSFVIPWPSPFAVISVTGNAGASPGNDVTGVVMDVYPIFTDDRQPQQHLPDASYPITIATAGTGTGSVAKSPNLTRFAPEEIVVLTATADGGSVFAGWSGDASGTLNPLPVKMNMGKSITATFNLE